MNLTLKRKIVYGLIAVVSLQTVTVVLWERARAPLFDWFDGDTIVYERPAKEVSEYDSWLKRPEVQKQLGVMFERYKLDQAEAELKNKEKELEDAKEQLRAKELELGSLE